MSDERYKTGRTETRRRSRPRKLRGRFDRGTRSPGGQIVAPNDRVGKTDGADRTNDLAIARGETPGIGKDAGRSETPGTGKDVGRSETPGIGKDAGRSETPGIGKDAGRSETPGIGKDAGRSETPVGRKDETTAPESEAVFSTVQVESPTKRGRPTRRALRAAEFAEHQKNAALIVAILDGTAQSLIGADCAMNATEQGLIADPLARILSRLDPVISDGVNKFADPAAVFLGLGIWASRIIKTRRANLPPEIPAAELLSDPPDKTRDNGGDPRMPLGNPPEVVQRSYTPI